MGITPRPELNCRPDSYLCKPFKTGFPICDVDSIFSQAIPYLQEKNDTQFNNSSQILSHSVFYIHKFCVYKYVSCNSFIRPGTLSCQLVVWPFSQCLAPHKVATSTTFRLLAKILMTTASFRSHYTKYLYLCYAVQFSGLVYKRAIYSSQKISVMQFSANILSMQQRNSSPV